MRAQFLLMGRQVARDAFAGFVGSWILPAAARITDLFVEHSPLA
ncbi:Unknown protein sequence [Pseudomonas syringae pv. cilantro]|uniref:Uncharacterized protein n=1 Tax=Pseudomonas syringae pv. cilantro TaxID=81035 RepID=A0A0N1JNJ8_PSESX|nr:Unknown protein sequence [Pseudomonas syringae pv. cilantro]